MAAEVVQDAALNRALLARQHLLRRTAGSVEDVVHHLVGLQAQNPSSPYPALWSRVEGFRHDDLATAMLDRRVTRIAVMRGTIHLLTADDALLLPAVTAPLFLRDLRTNAAFGPALRDVDLDEVAAVARDLVEAEPMTGKVLGARLAERFDVDPQALAYAARGTLALVQVTPRGVWGRSGATTWTTTRAWLGREPHDLSDDDARAAALEGVTFRYLAAFGPASVADLQHWSGLTGLRPCVERLRDRLVAVRAAPTATGRPGRELLDLPDAPRPDPATPAPPRFVPDFDNLTLSHAERNRIVTDAHRRLLTSPNGIVPGRVLLDGMVAGTWDVETVRGGRSAGATSTTVTATLTISVFDGRVSGGTDLLEEAEAFVRLLADEADVHRVVVRAA